MIRVAIIDDNPESRKDLVRILGKESDIRVVAEAEANPAGIREIEQQKPDVIVLENNKPFTDNLEATQTIVSMFENTRVIVLAIDSRSTMLPLYSKHAMAASFCQVGACFHLCENCRADEILAAIKAANSAFD